MCNTCGCDPHDNSTRFTIPDSVDAHDQEHFHSHSHDHRHTHSTKTVQMEQDVLAQNKLLAERNRGYFEAKNIFAMNLVSSPGSGKTTLLEKTITDMKVSCNHKETTTEQE